MVTQLYYSNTNTYTIKGSRGSLLLDTGWAGTFPQFCRALGENDIKLSEIKFLLISHFHPDHMGIAQEIADNGVQIVVMDVQRDFIHTADRIFEKENKFPFQPIKDSDVRVVSITDSRSFLAEIGISGEIFHTPGHSEDSISLLLDSGELFVGDLNPLYELEMHRGTLIAESWDMLLSRNAKIVYYGHAKIAVLDDDKDNGKYLNNIEYDDLYSLTKRIMKYIKRGYPTEKIVRKTGADEVFIGDVARIYVTHRDVDVQGILDRIEIKGR